MQNRVGPPDVPSGRPELRRGSGHFLRRPGRRRSPTLQATRVRRRPLRRGTRRRGWQPPRHPERTPWWTNVGPTRESEHDESRSTTRDSEKVGARRTGKESQPSGMHHVGPRVAALPSNPLTVGPRNSRQGARRRKSRPRAARDARLAPVEDDADAPAVWLA